MRAIHFFAAICVFAFGVAVRTFFPVPMTIIVLALVISLAIGIIWRRNQDTISAPFVLLLSVLICSFSVGLLRVEVASWQFGVSELGAEINTEIAFTGTVSKEPKKSTNTTQLYISNQNDTILVSTDRYSPIEYGDVVQVSGTLTEPDSFETDLGRTFDYPGYLKAKGVEYTVSFADVVVLERNQGNMFLRVLLNLKHVFMAKLEQVIPEPQVGLGEGLLLGVKQALGEDVEENFRRTGIIHIVVLSGYNVMLVVTFFIFCFSFFLSARKRVIAGVIAIVCFALLVGLSATVVRASIMASLLLLAQGYSRQYDVMRALFFAGAVMIFLNPYLLIYDIGFQLSFMATLGLLLITPHFESTIITETKKLRLSDFFFATLATQIAVLPLLLYHIGEVSIVAIIVNVLVLPVVPVAMLLTFITGLLAFVSLPLASLVGFLANLALIYILLIAQWFAQIPFAAVAIPEFTVWGMLVLYIGMAGILLYLKYGQMKRPYSDWEIVEEKEEPVSSSKEKLTGSKGDTLPAIFR